LPRSRPVRRHNSACAAAGLKPNGRVVDAAARSDLGVPGAIWPPVTQHFVATHGWRATYIGIGLFCAVSLSALSHQSERPDAAGHAA